MFHRKHLILLKWCEAKRGKIKAGLPRSFPAQYLIHQPIRPGIARKALPQSGFGIGIAHPIQEGDARIVVLKGGEGFEKGVQNACARRCDMAVAQRKLGKCILRRVALQQKPDPGRKPGPIRARFAMDQRWFINFLENAGQAQNTVLMRRAAAFKWRVYMDQAKPRGLCPAKCIGPAIGTVTTQIDDGANAMAPRRPAQLPGQRVVGPVKPPRRHNAPIAPTKAQNGVVYEKRIAPGGGRRHAPLFQSGAGNPHRFLPHGAFTLGTRDHVFRGGPHSLGAHTQEAFLHGGIGDNAP